VDVEVVAGALDRIVLVPESITVQTGRTVLIQASWVDAYGNDIDEESMDWEGTIGSLTVSADGLSAELDAGDVAGDGVVTARHGDDAASASVTVFEASGVSTGTAFAFSLASAAVAVGAALLVMHLMRRRDGGPGPPAAPPDLPPTA